MTTSPDSPGASQSEPAQRRQHPGISVLRNTFAILRAFSVDAPLLGVTEIAEIVDLHKSTVSRILATLEAEAVVERDPVSRRFRLGLGVIGLAGPLLADLDVTRAANDVLNQTSEQTGETVALMMWTGSGTVCVAQVASRRQVKHSTPLGTRYQTVKSSSVQVFLAHMHEVRVRELLGDQSLSSTGMDLESLDGWLTRLREVRERGYAVNYGETSVEEVGVAAAVFDYRREPIAAILTSAPRFRISPEQVTILGETTLAAADRVTARLGGVHPARKDLQKRHW